MSILSFLGFVATGKAWKAIGPVLGFTVALQPCVIGMYPNYTAKTEAGVASTFLIARSAADLGCN